VVVVEIHMGDSITSILPPQLNNGEQAIDLFLLMDYFVEQVFNTLNMHIVLYIYTN